MKEYSTFPSGGRGDHGEGRAAVRRVLQVSVGVFLVVACVISAVAILPQRSPRVLTEEDASTYIDGHNTFIEAQEWAPRTSLNRDQSPVQ